MVPDLEVVPMFLVSGDIYIARGLMHSLLGALTIDAAVTVVAVWLLVPRLIRWVDRRWPGTHILTFAGQDLRRDPRDLPTLYASAAFGALTHVLVDVLNHAYNPVLWPWQKGPLNLLPFSDQLWYDLFTIAIWSVFLVVMMRKFWRR